MATPDSFRPLDQSTIQDFAHRPDSAEAAELRHRAETREIRTGPEPVNPAIQEALDELRVSRHAASFKDPNALKLGIAETLTPELLDAPGADGAGPLNQLPG